MQLFDVSKAKPEEQVIQVPFEY